MRTFAHVVPAPRRRTTHRLRPIRTSRSANATRNEITAGAALAGIAPLTAPALAPLLFLKLDEIAVVWAHLGYRCKQVTRGARKTGNVWIRRSSSSVGKDLLEDRNRRGECSRLQRDLCPIVSTTLGSSAVQVGIVSGDGA